MSTAIVEARNVLLALVVTTLLAAWVECLYLVLAGGPPKIEFFYLLDYMLTFVGFFGFQFVVLFAPTCLLDEECCCCNCCGWCCRGCLGQHLHHIPDEALTASFPAFLLLAALFPTSCVQLYLTQLALLFMLVILHRDSTSLGEWRGVAVDGALLSLLVRAVCSTENTLFWDWHYGWIVCLPTLALHAIVVYGVEGETSVSAIEDAGPTELGCTHNSALGNKEEAEEVNSEELASELKDTNEAVPPSRAPVVIPMESLSDNRELENPNDEETTEALGWAQPCSALFVSSTLVALLGFGTSPGLLVRGSGVEPDGASFTWPLVFPLATHISMQVASISGNTIELLGSQEVHRTVLHLTQIVFMSLFLFSTDRCRLYMA